jgi:hypothetical protein
MKAYTLKKKRFSPRFTAPPCMNTIKGKIPTSRNLKSCGISDHMEHFFKSDISENCEPKVYVNLSWQIGGRMGFREPEAEISCYPPPLIPLEYHDDFLQCVKGGKEKKKISYVYSGA